MLPGSVLIVGDQWHFRPDTYLSMVRSEIDDYDELQATIAEATEGLEVSRILDLGSGTGVTARVVLDRHPGAELVGVDASAEMLSHARALVPDATFVDQRLEDPLPGGPFDVVVSAFAIHHLDGDAKATLFAAVAASLREGGRFVMCDVVVPIDQVERPIPLDPHVDRPDLLENQIRWLNAAGLEATTLVERGDRAVIAADRSTVRPHTDLA